MAPQAPRGGLWVSKCDNGVVYLTSVMVVVCLIIVLYFQPRRHLDPCYLLGRYCRVKGSQFEWVTGYKLVGLGVCMEWIRAGTYYHWVIAQRGQLGRCPRLAGIPPPEGPMTPPPYLPVTAAASPATATPAVPAAPPVTAAPPATAVTSTQATIPKPPQGGGGRPRSKSQPQKRDAAAAGVQGATWDTGGAGNSSGRSGRATS